MSAIRTLGADIPAAEAGTILPHEHVFLNLTRDYRGEGLLNDVETAVAEVGAYAAAGGGTIVDLSVGELASGTVGSLRPDERPGDLEPDPARRSRPIANVRALQHVAARTGIRIVAGTGHYRDPYLDKDWFDRNSVDRIAENLVADLEEGFPGTDLRAGVIGEIGSDRWYVSAAEERSFRAAARAHLRTGAAITTHSNRWAQSADAHLALLEEEGVAPEKIIIGHVDLVPDPAHALRLAKRGTYVQFDYFTGCIHGGVVNRAALQRRVDQIVELVRAGYRDQVLVSHDVCLTSGWGVNGGSGYTFLLEAGREAFLEAGLAGDDVDHIMTANPQRVLSF